MTLIQCLLFPRPITLPKHYAQKNVLVFVREMKFLISDEASLAMGSQWNQYFSEQY